jgi:hypothetical protein
MQVGGSVHLTMARIRTHTQTYKHTNEKLIYYHNNNKQPMRNDQLLFAELPRSQYVFGRPRDQFC